MRVTSIATGASLNTRPDGPQLGAVDTTNDHHTSTKLTQQPLCQSFTVHLVCSRSVGGSGSCQRQRSGTAPRGRSGRRELGPAGQSGEMRCQRQRVLAVRRVRRSDAWRPESFTPRRGRGRSAAGRLPVAGGKAGSPPGGVPQRRVGLGEEPLQCRNEPGRGL